MKDKEFTLAELFETKGYGTAITGKWHLGGEKQSLPTYQGFDEYHVGILERRAKRCYGEPAAVSQSSTVSPLTRENSPVLLVTSVSP